LIYYEDSNGYWYKREFDEQENEVYYEDSNRLIIDNRPKVKELTVKDIEELLGYSVKVVK
jgi:hypothetical protein